jgi:hypothetical protein
MSDRSTWHPSSSEWTSTHVSTPVGISIASGQPQSPRRVVSSGLRTVDLWRTV